MEQGRNRIITPGQNLVDPSGRVVKADPRKEFILNSPFTIGELIPLKGQVYAVKDITPNALVLEPRGICGKLRKAIVSQANRKSRKARRAERRKERRENAK